jgi:23S rRNA pseudouridine1911/1915/1917 synthase
MTEDAGRDLFDGELLELAVPASLAGMRLDRALAMLTDRSRAETALAIVEGRVQINAAVIAKGSRMLVEGDVLRAQLRPPAGEFVEPDAQVIIEVVLDDEDFVVVNKLPRQVVHPGAGQRTGTLVAGLLARYPEIALLAREGRSEPARPGIVHRLDKGTSGLLVVAKTPLGLSALSAQMGARTAGRTYLSLVKGHVVEDRGIVDAPIGRSPRAPTLMAVRADGREARTHYDVRARLDEPYESSVLELRLDTGRTHQIRVHMASIAHAVVNDLRYGHQRDLRLDEDRLFLHASRLTFQHPRSDATVSLEAPLPPDLRALLPADLDL